MSHLHMSTNMAQTLESFVRTIGQETRIQIVRDYEVLRRHGFIGDSALRRSTEQYLGIDEDATSSTPVGLWLTLLANEIHRQMVIEFLDAGL